MTNFPSNKRTKKSVVKFKKIFQHIIYLGLKEKHHFEWIARDAEMQIVLRVPRKYQN